jgi:hypothetical protein
MVQQVFNRRNAAAIGLSTTFGCISDRSIIALRLLLRAFGQLSPRGSADHHCCAVLERYPVGSNKQLLKVNYLFNLLR